jgi:hypothetical protein
MTFNPWVKVDETKNEYASINEFLGNYRRPFGSPGFYSQSKKLYVIEFAGITKIGVTKNPRERINNLKREAKTGQGDLFN